MVLNRKRQRQFFGVNRTSFNIFYFAPHEEKFLDFRKQEDTRFIF